jgi:hypothetical protein
MTFVNFVNFQSVNYLLVILHKLTSFRLQTCLKAVWTGNVHDFLKIILFTTFIISEDTNGVVLTMYDMMKTNKQFTLSTNFKEGEE